MKQPFSSLSSVLSAEELVDFAFRRASKSAQKIPKNVPFFIKVRSKEKDRVRTAAKLISERLKRILKEMPRLEDIHPFYRELADILVGVGKLKRCLGAVNWASQMIDKLTRDYIHKLSKAKNISEAGNLRREAYGRMASILKQISNELETLREAQKLLVKLPSVNPEMPTIVVAGYTNVGKSTFVKQVSSAKPKIASYPFTTKKIIIGHRRTKHGKIQIIDTPGLLDRPLSERNRIELQAILALKYLAKAIIFIFDPTETCGYPLESQVNLYREIKQSLKKIPIVNVVNKADIAKKEQLKRLKEILGEEFMIMSALKNSGVEEVLERTLSILIEK